MGEDLAGAPAPKVPTAAEAAAWGEKAPTPAAEAERVEAERVEDNLAPLTPAPIPPEGTSVILESIGLFLMIRSLSSFGVCLIILPDNVRLIDLSILPNRLLARCTVIVIFALFKSWSKCVISMATGLMHKPFNMSLTFCNVCIVVTGILSIDVILSPISTNDF